MDRRRFLVNSVAGISGLGLSKPLRVLASDSDNKTEPLKIQYVREKIPTIHIPPYRGERYEDSVPDTVDVAEQAKLAIHGLTSITDPTADEEIFWYLDIFRNPVIMRHDMSDWVQMCEGFMEALPLLRIATGDSLNDHVDSTWMKVALKCLGPDGLYYVPLNGRPWSRYLYHVGNLSESDPMWRPDGTKTDFLDQSVAQMTTGEICARTLLTLSIYFMRDKNPMWVDSGKQMVQRLNQLAVHKDDFAYVTGAWEPNAKVGPDAAMPMAFLAEEWDGRLIQGLAQFYKKTGYEPALELAGKITRFYRYHAQYYDADGRFLFDEQMKKMHKEVRDLPAPTVGGHGHAHHIGLLAMLEYATAANDRDTMEFVRASYEWVKGQQHPFGVSTLVGWFPEWYVPNYNDCETCTLADMLGLAAKLTEAGLGDYWDELDRWLRNQFTAQQLTEDLVEPIYRFSETRPRTPLGPYEIGGRVVERNVGAWAGWAGPGDWAIKKGIQHCCTGSASRSLYYVWEHMLESKGEELRVNLLLNRASPWADVYSYIPYQGRVDVKMKKAYGHLLVRAPEWVEGQSPQIECNVNGKSRSARWTGRYVDVGSVKPGDKVTLTFPIAERTVKEWIGPGEHTLVIKGNTVVSIDPPGKFVPIYQDREKYRKSDVQWKKVNRFVSAESVLW